MSGKKFYWLLALAFIFASTPTLWAGGFSIKGKELKDFELNFDSSGYDLSSPKKSARSFLEAFITITKPEVMGEVEKIESQRSKKPFQKLFTDKAFAQYFPQKSSLRQSGVKISYDIDLKDVDKNSDGSATVEAVLKTTMSRACPRCKKAGEDCKVCKGKGKLKRSRDESLSVIVHSQDGKWLIKEVLQSCMPCQGKGDCPRCKKPGVKCATCLGSGKCRYCKGKGKKEAKMLEGPKVTENAEKYLDYKIDTSTVDKYFESYVSAINSSRASEKVLENKAHKGFHDFHKFFTGKSQTEDGKKKEFEAFEYKVVSKEEKGDELMVTYSRVRKAPQKPKMGSHPVKPRSSFKRHLILVKVDGQWRAKALVMDCWRCRRASKSPEKCEICKGNGYVKMQRFPH